MLYRAFILMAFTLFLLKHAFKLQYLNLYPKFKNKNEQANKQTKKIQIMYIFAHYIVQKLET